MSLPTSELVDGFSHWSFTQSVAEAIGEHRPDLASKIELVEDPRSPRVELPLSGGRRILIARVELHGIVSWAITTPDCKISRLTGPDRAEAAAQQMIAAHERFSD